MLIDFLVWFVSFTAVLTLGVLYYDEKNQITRIERRLQNMSAQLDRLAAEIAENNSVIDGAIELLAGLSAQIRDLKDDPAQLEALADEVDAQGARLAAALVANTE